ncbi:hypothetical protein MM213_04915 [Belliella sp. R4-6]|uniref:Secreted protein n=1 Tax=Belliella alkalica TaxID=1730871 RepID=A0ABS9V8S0_9BACT|nr:hypothetical protein [Belliella alkalica]MCH7412817.1 hypothetical protein [Belliella alkalica]
MRKLLLGIVVLGGFIFISTNAISQASLPPGEGGGGTADCYAIQNGTMNSVPICNSGCPYKDADDAFVIGTCNQGVN